MLAAGFGDSPVSQICQQSCCCSETRQFSDHFWCPIHREAPAGTPVPSAAKPVVSRPVFVCVSGRLKQNVCCCDSASQPCKCRHTSLLGQPIRLSVGHEDDLGSYSSQDASCCSCFCIQARRVPRIRCSCFCIKAMALCPGRRCVHVGLNHLESAEVSGVPSGYAAPQRRLLQNMAAHVLPTL